MDKQGKNSFNSSKIGQSGSVRASGVDCQSVPSVPVVKTVSNAKEVVESYFTRMLKQCRLELNHEYDTENKVYQILSKTYMGSLMLVAYVQDKEDGRFQKAYNNDYDDDNVNDENNIIPKSSTQNAKTMKNSKQIFNMRKVASIIMDHEFAISLKRFDRTKFLELRDACHALFPAVNDKEVWYRDTRVVNNIPVTANGVLFRIYTSYRDLGIAVGFIKS